MINIKINKDGFLIEGHANYASYGNDIVCSAISTLLQTFIQSIEELTKDKIKSDIRQGYAVIIYEDLTKSAQLLLDSFFIGVEDVSSAYPEHVKVTKSKPCMTIKE